MSLADPAATALPEGAGWLVLTALFTVFGLLTWWLFFSPLPRRVLPAVPSPRMLRTRRLLAVLVLATGALGVVGGYWDELWHRIYGGFGDDFLWPPHLLIYASLAANGVFAALGLAWALRGRGGLRDRFRAEPLLGLLGLLAAYQLASIPSDALWHELIGPDITAWSLPHLLLLLTISGVQLAGVALALSTLPARPWRSLADRPRGLELVGLGLIALIVLNMLHIGATEWEWRDAVVLDRPDWAYLVVVLLIGTACAHLALAATKRVGAASAVALAALVVHLGAVAFYRDAVPPGPLVASHLLLVPPALALDGWYGLRATRVRSMAARWAGSVLYAAVYFAVVALYVVGFTAPPGVDLRALLPSVAIGLPLALLVAPLAAHLGLWLAAAGRPPARANGTPLSPSVRQDGKQRHTARS